MKHGRAVGLSGLTLTVSVIGVFGVNTRSAS
jgi:hypothetical protein